DTSRILSMRIFRPSRLGEDRVRRPAVECQKPSFTHCTGVHKMQEASRVTGGAGFIGSHLVEALTALGRPVRVFDDFSTGMRTNLEKVRSAAEIVTGDVADPAAIERAMQGVKVVYHLAA